MDNALIVEVLCACSKVVVVVIILQLVPCSMMKLIYRHCSMVDGSRLD